MEITEQKDHASPLAQEALQELQSNCIEVSIPSRRVGDRFIWNALGLFLLAKGVYGDRVQINGLSAVAGVVLLLALAQTFVRPALFLFRCLGGDAMERRFFDPFACPILTPE